MDSSNDKISRPCPFSGIAVIGLGLIGSSCASAIRSVWPDVRLFGVDTDERTVTKAIEQGMVDKAVYPDDASFERFVSESCDLAIIATPVDVAGFYFDKFAQWGYGGLITDTASTKMRICSMADEMLSADQKFVPGHPMCGSEKNGIEGARTDLFQGAYWILCPNDRTDGDDLQHLHEFVTGLGARMISVPREQHDRAVAVVSHVPHLVASSLVTLANHAADEQRNIMRLAAGGFKDTTRIAAGSADLWTGIEFDNAEEVLSGIDDMCDILQSFASALREGDRSGMERLLADAADVRRALPASWVPSTERLLEVRIPIPQRNGVVAEVTTIASSVGCNIQSIEIDHLTENSAVLNMLLTDEGDIGKLSFELINAGFSVSFSPLSPKEHTHVD
jgi:prephenate dehydrogenase